MATSATVTVRNIASLNPLKRMKFKENQVIIPFGTSLVDEDYTDDDDRDSENLVLKRKIPLGALGSIENVMFNAAEPPRKPLGQLQSAATPGRRKSADPKSAITAVERRNARERNRVQQVNNGFAALRQRIPEEIAEAFESGQQTRGIHKKLSKVETLRMAVEYIKCLERLLSLDPDHETTGSIKFVPQPPSSSTSSSPTQLPATPPPEPVQSNNFFLAIKPRAMGNANGGSSLDQTQITIINGHQYIRIPGTNTFQYLDPESLYDESPNDSSFFGGEGSSVQDIALEDSSDLMSESAIALSPPGSNFTEHDSDHHHHSGRIVSLINQQQYADLMLIKSELEDHTGVEEEEEGEESLLQAANADPAGFLETINWFESHHQHHQQ